MKASITTSSHSSTSTSTSTTVRRIVNADGSGSGSLFEREKEEIQAYGKKMVGIKDIDNVMDKDREGVKYKDKVKDVDMDAEVSESSSSLPFIQNRLIHYGVYCGPGPADAFGGENRIGYNRTG